MRALVNEVGPGTPVKPWSLTAARYSNSLSSISHVLQLSADPHPPNLASNEVHGTSAAANPHGLVGCLRALVH